MKEAVFPPDASATKGPYSPAIVYKDLVFVSGKLDGMSGGDVIREIHDYSENTPIIAVTGGATDGGFTDEDLIYIDHMHPMERLDKPFSLKELKNAISKYLGSPDF